MEATPRPWVQHHDDISDGNGGYVATTHDGINDGRGNEANAELIVRAVNSHDKLVEAVRLLREAVVDGHLDLADLADQGKVGTWATVNKMARALESTEGLV